MFLSSRLVGWDESDLHIWRRWFQMVHLPLELHQLFDTFPLPKTKVVVHHCQPLNLWQARGPSSCWFLAWMTEVLQSGSTTSRMQVGLQMGGTHCLQLHQGLVATIYIMYSRQLPWGILISYCKWNEINFISFMANISFLISNAISFLHSVYFIFSKFYFICSRHLFHSPRAFVSFICGMYLILPRHLFHL